MEAALPDLIPCFFEEFCCTVTRSIDATLLILTKGAWTLLKSTEYPLFLLHVYSCLSLVN